MQVGRAILFFISLAYLLLIHCLFSVMYAPIIRERINNSLVELQQQMTILENSLLNPSNITTPLPPTVPPANSTNDSITSATLPPSIDDNVFMNFLATPPTITTPKPVKNETRIYREFGLSPQAWFDSYGNANGLPILDGRQVPKRPQPFPNVTGIPASNITSTTVQMNSTTPAVNETIGPATNITTSFGTITSTPINETTTVAPVNITTVAPVNITTVAPSNITTAVPSNITTTFAPANITTTTPPENMTTTAPPVIPTAADIARALYTILNSSELIMMDILSKDRVTELEECLKTITAANNYIWQIDLSNATETLLYWMALAKLSTKHSLKRMEEQRLTFIYIEKLDDITSLITAAFCILAILCTAYMCYLSSRNHKPYVVSDYPPYNNEPSYRIRNNNNSTTPPSVGIRSARTNSDLYNSSTGATTRSNPLYSSQRSVDVDRPRPEEVPSVFNSESPKADDIRYDPSPDRTEKNTNINRERRLPQQSGPRSTDYRDPRRNRRSNLDQYRDNPGFIGDDGNPARPNNSESAL